MEVRHHDAPAAFFRANGARYPLNRRLCGPRNRSLRSEEEKNLSPTRIRTLDHLAPRHSHTYRKLIALPPRRDHNRKLSNRQNNIFQCLRREDCEAVNPLTSNISHQNVSELKYMFFGL